MDLPKEIIVAIVAAVGATAVGLIGLASALRSAREARHTQAQMEELKARFADIEERRARRVAVVEKRAELLAQDVAAIQNVRDELRRLIDAPAKISRTADALQSLARVIAAAEQQYTSHYSADPSPYLSLMHEAKNVSLAIARQIDGVESEFVSDISEEVLRDVRYARSQLQSIQERLRNEQLTLINDIILVQQ